MFNTRSGEKDMSDGELDMAIMSSIDKVSVHILTLTNIHFSYPLFYGDSVILLLTLKV